MFVLEVCVDSVASAVNAEAGGASRLELCGNLGMGGGTTPSIGLLRAIRKVLPSIPIMAMIRPRTGDFVYSDDELEVMLEDIRAFKEENIQGIVAGVLTKEGRVNVGGMRRIVNSASPLEVCFHRAFDMTKGPEEAFDDVCTIGGITRILTSGHEHRALDGLDVLASLFNASSSQSTDPTPAIMPGSGVGGQTIGQFLQRLLPLGLKEIHMSGGSWEEGKMEFRREGFGMGVGGSGEWGVWRTNADHVREVRQHIDRVSKAETT